MKQLWKRYEHTIWTCVSILIGNVLLALSVGAFILPHGIITGGVTGIGILLSRFLPVDVAVLVLIMNILALGLGLFALGKKFVLTTISSSLLYPVLLSLVQRIPGIDAWTGNTLLSALFGGGLLGIALGLVMRVGASTGGVDVVNLVLSKWTHLPVSVFVYLTDFLILGGQALFSTPEQILYGIVLLVLETLTLNQVMLLGQSQIQILTVSSRYEEIRQRLLKELKAGVTMLLIETGYGGCRQKGVLCVIHPRKLYDARELILSVDPEAFITVTQIKEVRGQGFTLARRDFDASQDT